MTGPASACIAIAAAVLLSLPALTGRAQTPEERFQRAAEAAAQSDWGEALRGYRELEDAGYGNGELHFNLAVACEAEGECARSVWYYLRSMRARPYDPQLRRNLSRVLWQAGAPGYRSPDAPGRGLRRLPVSSWTWAVRLGYTGFAVSLGLMAWPGKVKRWGGVVLASGLALLLLGGAGSAAWALADRSPEAVVVGDDVPARFAPVNDHAVHFHLPHAAVVRCVRGAGEWRLVDLDGRKGWVPSGMLAPLDMNPSAWVESRKGVR